MDDILSLEEFRTVVGTHPTDTRDDAKFSALLPYVSAAIRSFTERDFGAPIITEERTYEYDGSGYLDIDDAQSITSVVLTYPNTADLEISSDSWMPKPERRDDSPVYQYILMPAYAGAIAGSPEMGFLRNADVYAREHAGPYTPTSRVKVLAEWGWPDVPGDVKMAAVWTLQEWIARPTGEALTSESIEGWSRAWGGRNGEMAALAIPARARDILANYAKVNF